MESIRVDIRYRPMRIGWAIRAGDVNSFRSAARVSFALWGGRFNPIIVVDQEDLAQNLVDLFRPDMVIPVGDSDIVKSFAKRFHYLLSPFFSEGIFMGNGRSQVLDVHNALVYLQTRPEWEAVKKRGVRLYSWAPDDPLCDVFLMQFGQYPNRNETQIDYYGLLKGAADAIDVEIEKTSRLAADLLQHPSISSLSRCNVKDGYTIGAGWNNPGFYSGDSRNLDDLVCCWNLGAAGIKLWFVDPQHLDRYADTVEVWPQLLSVQDHVRVRKAARESWPIAAT